MDAAYAADLKRRCPAPARGVPDNLLNNSAASPAVLDNQFYKIVVARRVLFTSDAALLNRTDTAAKVADMAAYPEKWIAQFALSMVKMGSINVTTGTQGQVRRLCRAINS
jgi:peroxidase